MAADLRDDLPDVPKYPALLKHMVLAVFLKGHLPRARRPKSRNKIPVPSSPNKDIFDPTKFNAAMDIALAQLKKYGYITERSSRLEVTLTSKGKRLDADHKRESGGMTKTRKFDKYYIQLIEEHKKRVSKRAPKQSQSEQEKVKERPEPLSPRDRQLQPPQHKLTPGRRRLTPPKRVLTRPEYVLKPPMKFAPPK